MSDESAFVLAIRANPGDDTARLAFADWLDEHDRPGGEFLRAVCRLTAIPVPHASGTAWQSEYAAAQRAAEGLPVWWRAAVSRPPFGNCGEVIDRFADLDVRPRFWELVDAAGGDAERMRAILTGLSRADLIQFDLLFADVLQDLVFRVVGPHGDAPAEEEIAACMVSRGVANYASVWDHPEEFPSALPDAVTFDGLSDAVLEERFPGVPWTAEELRAIAFWPTARGSTILLPGPDGSG